MNTRKLYSALLNIIPRESYLIRDIFKNFKESSGMPAIKRRDNLSFNIGTTSTAATKRDIHNRFINQHAKSLCPCGRITRIFIYGECVTEVCAGNPANWLVNSRRTRQTGFSGFDQGFRPSQHFSQREKKSSFDRPNNASIQVVLIKISVKKNVVKKFVLTDKFYFVNFCVNEFKVHEIDLNSNVAVFPWRVDIGVR